MTSSGSDLQVFMADNLPDKKQSKLMPFIADIQTLASSGYSYKSIARYLRENKGIQISEVSVGRFINKEIRAEEISAQKNTQQKPAKNTRQNYSDNKTVANSFVLGISSAAIVLNKL